MGNFIQKLVSCCASVREKNGRSVQRSTCLWLKFLQPLSSFLIPECLYNLICTQWCLQLSHCMYGYIPHWHLHPHWINLPTGILTLNLPINNQPHQKREINFSTKEPCFGLYFAVDRDFYIHNIHVMLD